MVHDSTFCIYPGSIPTSLLSLSTSCPLTRHGETRDLAFHPLGPRGWCGDVYLLKPSLFEVPGLKTAPLPFLLPFSPFHSLPFPSPALSVPAMFSLSSSLPYPSTSLLKGDKVKLNSKKPSSPSVRRKSMPRRRK